MKRPKQDRPVASHMLDEDEHPRERPHLAAPYPVTDVDDVLLAFPACVAHLMPRMEDIRKGQTMNHEDVNKLPKWAQLRIQLLESQVDEWRKKALAPATREGFAVAGAPRIEVLARESRRGFDSIPLVSNRVVFTVGNSDLDISPAWSDSRCNGLPDSLNVSSRQGRLDIEPRASNAIWIRGKP